MIVERTPLGAFVITWEVPPRLHKGETEFNTERNQKEESLFVKFLKACQVDQPDILFESGGV